MAITSRTWTKPPMVVAVTRPRAQRTMRTMAMVINMGSVLSLVGWCGKSAGGVLDVVAGVADIVSEAAHRTATGCQQGEKYGSEGEKGEA